MSTWLRVSFVLALLAVAAYGGWAPMSHASSDVAAARPPGAICSSTDDCEFSCTRTGDSWYGSDGVWVIVHSKPYIDGTSTELRWWDTGLQYWAPMVVEGIWKEPGGGSLTYSVEVDDDGDCDTTNAGGKIRCHNDTSNSPLCDGYGGIWT